jgi:hypothetical protein
MRSCVPDLLLRSYRGTRLVFTLPINRDVKDRDGVAKGLGERGNGDDLEMAEIVMRSTTPDS